MPYPIVAQTLEEALLTSAPADHPDEHDGLEAELASGHESLAAGRVEEAAGAFFRAAATLEDDFVFDPAVGPSFSATCRALADARVRQGRWAEVLLRMYLNKLNKSHQS